MRAVLTVWRTERSPPPPNRAPAAAPPPTRSAAVGHSRFLTPTPTSSCGATNMNHVCMSSYFFKSDVAAPFKKRHHKYAAETTPASSDHLLRPLSPITPPLPEDSLHSLLHLPCGSVLPNGLVYSPMPSQPTSRCNTPLQFEVRVPTTRSIFRGSSAIL